VKETLEDVKAHIQMNYLDKAKEALSEGISHINDRQKLILLAEKSEFGWKTVEEYTQHELADDDKDEKNIQQAEEWAEKAVKSLSNKEFKKQSTFAIRIK
jgi:hypothetical protein